MLELQVNRVWQDRYRTLSLSGWRGNAMITSAKPSTRAH